MHIVSTVTEENRISLGLRRETIGDVEKADLVLLTPQEARALASQLVSRAELAERRARLAMADAAGAGAGAAAGKVVTMADWVPPVDKPLVGVKRTVEE
jgi:hypothetical protein